MTNILIFHDIAMMNICDEDVDHADPLDADPVGDWEGDDECFNDMMIFLMIF